MYHRKKERKKKMIIIFTSIIGIFLLLFASVSLNRNYSFFETILKDVSMFFDKVIMYPFTALNKEKGACHLADCAKHRRKTAYGFIWKLKEEN